MKPEASFSESYSFLLQRSDDKTFMRFVIPIPFTTRIPERRFPEKLPRGLLSEELQKEPTKRSFAKVLGASKLL